MTPRIPVHPHPILAPLPLRGRTALNHPAPRPGRLKVEALCAVPKKTFWPDDAERGQGRKNRFLTRWKAPRRGDFAPS